MHRLVSSCGHDLKALILFRRHLVDQLDFLGQIRLHRLFSVPTLLARSQPDVVNLVRQAGRPLFKRKARVAPGLGASG